MRLRTAPLLITMSLFTLGACAGQYEVSDDVPAMTEVSALRFLGTLPAEVPATPWVCGAGDGYYGSGSVQQLTLDGALLELDVRHTSYSVPVTQVNTITGEVAGGVNEAVREERYRMDVQKLSQIRIINDSYVYGCGRTDTGRWIRLTDGSGLVLMATPPAAVFDQTVAALQALNPDTVIKAGVGF